MKKTAIFLTAAALALALLSVVASAVTGPYTGDVNHGYGEQQITGYGDRGGRYGTHYGTFDSDNRNSRVGGGDETTDTSDATDTTDTATDDTTDSGIMSNDKGETERDTTDSKNEIMDDANDLKDEIKDEAEDMKDDIMNGDGGSKVGIVVAILIAVAVVVLIVALIPKMKG